MLILIKNNEEDDNTEFTIIMNGVETVGFVELTTGFDECWNFEDAGSWHMDAAVIYNKGFIRMKVFRLNVWKEETEKQEHVTGR